MSKFWRKFRIASITVDFEWGFNSNTQFTSNPGFDTQQTGWTAATAASGATNVSMIGNDHYRLNFRAPLLVWITQPGDVVNTDTTNAVTLLENYPKARYRHLTKPGRIRIRVPPIVYQATQTDSGATDALALNYPKTLFSPLLPLDEDISSDTSAQTIKHGRLRVGIIGKPQITYTLRRIITVKLQYSYPYVNGAIGMDPTGDNADDDAELDDTDDHVRIGDVN